MDHFPLDLNLRIVWGGPKAASYIGTIELDGGLLSGTQQLGIDPHDPSFLLKDSNGRLAIDDSQTRFGGCDIRVQAKSNSRLKLQLQISDPESAQTIVKEYTWSLKSIRDNPVLQELGFNDCRLSIDRVPGDRLRVVTGRTHLVYNSEEPLNLQIQPYGLPWFSTTGNLDCVLVRVDDEHQVSRKSKTIALDGRGHGETYDVLNAAPKEEGVYELRFKFEPKHILPAILVRNPSIERVVQFIVYNNTPATPPPGTARPQIGADGESSWHPQIQILPKSFETQSITSRLAGQIDSSKRFPFFEIAKSFSAMPKEHPATESNLQIAPGAIATTTLHSLIPGQMHRLTVLSSSINASFRVSMVATGNREPKSNEYSLVNEVFDVSPTHSIHSVLHPTTAVVEEEFAVQFWPPGRQARLEITNLNASTSLNITGTLVDTWGDSTDVRIESQNLTQQQSSILELHSANVRSAFGSESISVTGTSSPAYDDWRLFLRFAKQIGNYCKANGYDSLAMTVHTEGSSLFPCSKLSSNARFDTGTFSVDGRDPFRKDIVELMYRAMSRYGVEFVPMLELDSPIREIEEAFSNADNSDLLQHRDSVSLSYAPHNHLYNPLSSRVQQAITSALGEFESRYRSHPNYRGIALRATTTSHLDVSIPIDQTNTSILDRFAGAVGGNLPKDTALREQFISQRLQGAYSQWLKESILGFLGKLKSNVRWVSVENEQTAIQTSHSPAVVSPIQIGPENVDLAQVRTTIVGQWNLGTPNSLHVAMVKPVNCFDKSLTRLARIAKPLQFQNAVSLPYHDNSRTVSRVRVWASKDSGNSLLISNAGAVSESVHLAWDRLPKSYQLASSAIGDISNSTTRVETNLANMDWRIGVAAGEVIRIDLPDNEAPPMYWYCQEIATIRSLDSALQSLEQAVSRLSIPQPRVGTLSNPSFESLNNTVRRGRLSGWTTSIDPNASVNLDSHYAADGKSSIRIESNSSSSIAWIQSDPFALMQSDRLFISFQSAAEQLPQQVTLSLSQFDSKSDRFETIAVRDFADRVQSRKGQPAWSNVGIDLSNEFRTASQGNEATLYRLQFEAKGQGRLWLDDVSVSTSFLRDGERRDLRSELFLARGSLQNGDSSPSVAMLNSPRGRLVQWGDSSLTKQKVMVSIRADISETKDTTPLSTELQQSVESRGDSKSTDAKQRPIKRLRNFWWQRKE